MLVPLIVVAVLVSIVLAEARVLMVVVAIVMIRRKVVAPIVPVGVRSKWGRVALYGGPQQSNPGQGCFG